MFRSSTFFTVALLLGSGLVVAACSSSPQPASEPASAQADQLGGAQVQVENRVADSDLAALPPSNGVGQYIDYSETAVAEATADGGTAVLFFHANWCPTCRSADSNISSRADEIPENVTIIKTDYDSNRALRNQYGITGQHTFVQVDAQGNEITKWVGGGLDEIITRTQS